MKNTMVGWRDGLWERIKSYVKKMKKGKEKEKEKENYIKNGGKALKCIFLGYKLK